MILLSPSSMPLYEIGQTVFIRETGKKHEPGDVVDLAKEVADAYLASNPGIMKPARVGQPAAPQATRAKKSRARK